MKVVDKSTGLGIVNLTANSDAVAPLEDGYAYDDNGIPFWFMKDRTYNFSIDTVAEDNSYFNITSLIEPDGPWKPSWRPTGTELEHNIYNYTLHGNTSITFNILTAEEINFSYYFTSFYDYDGPNEIYYGENMLFWVNFTYTKDNGVTWSIVSNPNAKCTLKIKLADSEDVIFSEVISNINNGNYSIIFNAGNLDVPAGQNQEYYTIEMHGTHPIYDDPDIVSFLVKVKAIPTTFDVINYENRQILPERIYHSTFGQLLNISIKYYETGGTQQALLEAIVNYESLKFGSDALITDPTYSDYYYASIDTSLAEAIGIYTLSVNVSLENHTTHIFLISINIGKRPTTLNGQSGLVYINEKVWIEDPYLITFSFRDSLSTELEGELNLAIYSWQELDEQGNLIPGESGSGVIIENEDKTHTLNFNTEHLSSGFYQLYATFQKNNYEEKYALISLEIRLREFDSDLSATDLEDGQVNVVQGDEVEFELELIDETRNIPLTGAIVVLELGDEDYEFDEEEPGVYTYTFKTENIEAYFASKTFTGEIHISKANFTSDEIDITIVVQMEEIFDGMPSFYFIMILSLIIGVTGSLVSYRIIQQARIPRHIKKIRKIKKKIKSEKPITEDYSIPTAEQMLVK
ncbi:MAG: hypothetical protein GF353_25390, partial [Candidatus Lokiarchaeota archaeon]|nr:hypothetical protein [Candidatus Lokiarchaeota archaeon]